MPAPLRDVGLVALPDAVRVKRSVEVGGDVAIDAGFMRMQIGEKQIAADALNHCGNIALHARHVIDRQAKTDEGGRVVDVDISQVSQAKKENR